VSLPLSNNQRGVLAICGCMASYTVNDVVVKQILLTYPVGEVIFVRGIITSLLIGAIALALGQAQELRAGLNRQVAARSLFDGLSTAGFIAALAQMKLANIAALLQIAPLLITALSVVLYREVVGWRRWAAIGVGFFGALLVIKPVPSEFNVWAIVGAGSALAAALREIMTRQIGRKLPVMVVVFWGSICIMLFGLLFIATEDWRTFGGWDFVQLCVAAIFMCIALYLMALGFRDVDLSVVAPFRYSYLITSAVGGYVAFRELPDDWTVVGAILIVGGGIYTLHREAVNRRELTMKSTTAA
jgi:drug/metabolite transporter (DMT)-like permease